MVVWNLWTLNTRYACCQRRVAPPSIGLLFLFASPTPVVSAYSESHGSDWNSEVTRHRSRRVPTHNRGVAAAPVVPVLAVECPKATRPHASAAA